jgi:hypothetical protein
VIKRNERTIFIFALVAHILCPLGVSIINFKINSKVFIFFDIKLSISFKDFSFRSAISFQGTILNRTLLIINDIHKETFPVTNGLSLDFLPSIVKFEYSWIYNIWIDSGLQCLLAANIFLFDTNDKVCTFNTVWTLDTKAFRVCRTVGGVGVQ